MYKGTAMIQQYTVLEGTKYELSCACVTCGEDMSVTICGGTKAHVGAVSLAVYEPIRNSATVSTICAYTHRDDIVAAKTAKKLAGELRCTVTVTVGIHIDDASNEEVQLFVRNCLSICDKIIEDRK